MTIPPENETTTSAVRIPDYRFAIVPEELLFDPAISGNAKALYGVIYRHGNTPKGCYPSRRRLADLMGLSPTSVDRHMAELKKTGWVLTYSRFNEGGVRVSNGYEIRQSASGVADDPGPELASDLTKTLDPYLPTGGEAPPHGRVGHLPTGGEVTYPRAVKERESFKESHLKKEKKEQRKRVPVTQEADDTRGSLALRATPKKKVEELSEDLQEVSNLFVGLVENTSGYKPKVNDKWRRDLRLLATRGPIEAEGVPTVDDLMAVIRWSLGNDFWADKITSPTKLRKHWLTLQGQMRRRSKPTNAEKLSEHSKTLDGVLTSDDLLAVILGEASQQSQQANNHEGNIIDV